MAQIAKARPINAEHSINEVVFVLEFPRELSEAQALKVAELEVKLEDELPKFEKLQALAIQVKDNQFVNTDIPTVLAGVSFKSFTDDGQLEWSLRAEKNFIIVNCTNYSRWKNVWPRARSYLQLAAELVMGPDYPIQAIVLQYIDRFVYSGNLDNYSVGEIFNEDSVYLPRNIIKNGASWHIHQGWFDATDNAGRRLNRINIDIATDPVSTEHLSTIDHQGIMQFMSPLVSSKALFDGEDNAAIPIDLIFDELHINNKDILSNLLSEQMVNEIKLNA